MIFLWTVIQIYEGRQIFSPPLNMSIVLASNQPWLLTHKKLECYLSEYLFQNLPLFAEKLWFENNEFREKMKFCEIQTRNFVGDPCRCRRGWFRSWGCMGRCWEGGGWCRTPVLPIRAKNELKNYTRKLLTWWKIFLLEIDSDVFLKNIYGPWTQTKICWNNQKSFFSNIRMLLTIIV